MKRVLVRDLSKCVGSEATVKGWSDTVRDQKAVQFILLRDDTGLIQIVVERNSTDPRLNDLVAKLSSESAIVVTGNVVQNAKSKTSGIEIIAKDINVLNLADPQLPIDLSERDESDMGKRLNWRYL